MSEFGSCRTSRIFSLLMFGALGVVSLAQAAGDAAWKTRIPAHAQIGSTPIEGTQFEFACTDGKGGAISIALIVRKPESLKAFPLDEFEGPDAIGETHKLAEWSVSGGKQPARARTSISGWYGVDGDGFVFSTARESGRPSDIARVAKRLVASDKARLRLVVKPLKGGEALKVEAPIAGHHEAVARILAPCLSAVK